MFCRSVAPAGALPYWGVNPGLKPGANFGLSLRDKLGCAEHGEQWSEFDGCNRGGGIAEAVRQDEVFSVDEGAAGVDDIWDVAFPLVSLGGDQWVAEMADHLRWVFEIED